MMDPRASAGESLNYFGWPDYLVFASMLIISLAIGIYYGCTGSKQSTTAEFFVGGRSMGVFPVAMSLAASFYSASGIMGVSAEMYRYGTMLFLQIFSFLALVPAVIYFYAPIFHRLKVASSFEYLERRFHVSVRKMASLILIFQMVTYMATAVWAPALALSQVTGMPALWVMSANMIVCAVYSTIGGFKAVLWTDTFQYALMLISLYTVLFKGNSDVGGFSAVLNASLQTGRIELFEFDPDPSVRHSVWSVVIGGYFMWLAIFGVNQAQVQRYVSLPSVTHIRRCLVLSFVFIVALHVANYYVGLVIYARYQHCDPHTAGIISKIDQLLPLFIIDTLGSYPGLPGLLVAGLYSAALSTVSSGLNSLAAVAFEDFVRPIFPAISETRATVVSKGLSLFFALFAYGIVFLMANVGHLSEAVLSILGLAGGPLLGVFTLGMFFPWANSLGAFCGLIASVALMFWIGFGAMYIRVQGLLKYATKPISIHGCAIKNETTWVDLVSNSTLAAVTSLSTPTEPTPVLAVYKLSYMWYSATGFLFVIVIGLIVSGLRGFQNPRVLDPDLVVNMGDALFWYLPKKVREFLRFHVGDHHYKGKRVPNVPEEVPLTQELKPSYPGRTA